MWCTVETSQDEDAKIRLDVSSEFWVLLWCEFEDDEAGAGWEKERERD